MLCICGLNGGNTKETEQFTHLKNIFIFNGTPNSENVFARNFREKIRNVVMIPKELALYKACLNVRDPICRKVSEICQKNIFIGQQTISYTECFVSKTEKYWNTTAVWNLCRYLPYIYLEITVTLLSVMFIDYIYTFETEETKSTKKTKEITL